MEVFKKQLVFNWVSFLLEERMGYLCLYSFFFPFSSCPINLSGTHYMLDPGVIKRVRLSAALWEFSGMGKLDTQRNDKKSMNIEEQIRYFSEFVKTSQKN